MNCSRIIAIATVLSISPLAGAQGRNGTLPVQGALYDRAGDPIDTTVSVRFSLWDGPDADDEELWSDTLSVTPDAGFFTVYLGAGGTPLDLRLFRDQARVYLELKVGDDAPMDRMLLAAAPTAAYSHFSAGPFESGRVAWAWANNPTSASYSPSATYSYNSSGGDITITRISTGHYTVSFEGLRTGTVGGGIPMVTAQVPSNADTPRHVCRPGSWSEGGADDPRVYVICYDSEGDLVDSYFNIILFF
jgi:hypothetical protein